MTFVKKTSLLALVLAAAACATGGGGGGGASGVDDRFMQADYKMPEDRAISDDGERAIYQDAKIHISRAREAQRSGNNDQARAEFRAGAEIFQKLGTNYASSEWRLVYRRAATEYFLLGQDYAAAGRNAEALRVDPVANAASKAFAARLAGGAWQSEANAKAKAGEIEPLKLLSSSQRKGEPPRPRTPPEPWKRFVDAADAYVAQYQADPDPKAPEYAAMFAFIAGQVHFAFDNMEEAGKRFETVLTQFTSSEPAADAAQFYLQTYAVRNDQAGYKAALEKVGQTVDKATAEAAASNTPEAKERAARLVKVKEQIAADQRQMGFVEASNLLQAGKSAEAAAMFEQYVDANPQSGDAASALYNAAIAWDRAGDAKKANAARERLVASYPDAKVAGTAMLAMASARAKAGDHGDAADLYGRYLDKYPQGENRCLALLNVGIEYDQAKKPGEAAKRYLAFSDDPKCLAEDPDNSATLLFRAAQFFETSKKPAERKAALQKLAALDGVKGAVQKSYVAEAKNQLKKLK